MPIIPPIVQRVCVDGSGPNRSPCGAAARCRSACTTPGWTTAVRASGSIDDDPVEVPEGVDDDAGADGVAGDRGAGTAHGDRHAGGPGGVEDGVELVGGARPDHHLRDHAVERGVGGVERPGQGRVVDVGDAPPAQLRDEVCGAGGHLTSVPSTRRTPSPGPPPWRLGGGREQPLLLGGAGDEVVDVAGAVPDLGQAVGDPDVAHQRGEHAASSSGPSPVRVGVEDPGRAQVPLGRSVEGEPERRRRGQRDRHPVRHDRLVVGVARRHEVADPAGDRVGVGVRDVHAGVAEAQPGEGGGHRHLLARLASSPSATAVRNAPASSVIAFSAHMSAIGLAPQ